MGFSFNHLPINTLVGADSATFKAITASREIESEYRRKYLLTAFLQRTLSPLYNINKERYKKLETEKIVSPVFIIGHWRSGTTFLHNIMSQDSQFGYCTTFQTVFPHLMLYGNSLFKRLAALLMPDSRPTDSLKLTVEQPQEEEFAISNMTVSSFYHFWSFPKDYTQFCDRYLLLKGCREEEINELCQAIEQTITIALHSQKRRRFLSKNPPHTARIELLLRMFPDAKFIYVMRNPYTVFHSTINFFSSTIAPLMLQKISTAELEKHILQTYSALFDKYESTKNQIPAGNLVEIKLEQIEEHTMPSIEWIYQQLNLQGFEKSQKEIKQYIQSTKNFTKNRYNYDSRSNELIKNYCKKAIDKWGYSEL